MGLKTFNPVTPGLRQLVIVDRQGLHNGPPEKTLTVGKSSTGGRNNCGRITVRFRGGGHKRSYRLIDFKRRMHSGKKGIVKRFEYDPNRSAFVALIEYEDGALSYILAPQRLAVGDSVISGDSIDIKPGCSMPIGHMPIGTIVHNIEFKIGKGGGLARSAGAYAQIVGRDRGKVIVRLSSGEQRFIHAMCFATVGVLSNPDHMNCNDGKAGRTRWRGRRPHNRGVSMNPHDHPHGGGEGRTSGGRHPVTPWGHPTKGKKTRHNNRTDVFIISTRHKAKRR